MDTLFFFPIFFFLLDHKTGLAHVGFQASDVETEVCAQNVMERCLGNLLEEVREARVGRGRMEL